MTRRVQYVATVVNYVTIFIVNVSEVFRRLVGNSVFGFLFIGKDEI